MVFFENFFIDEFYLFYILEKCYVYKGKCIIYYCNKLFVIFYVIYENVWYIFIGILLVLILFYIKGYC